MSFDYDEFRSLTWEERTAILRTLSAEEKAELFRSQTSAWLNRHSTELTPPKIELLREAIELAVPEMYVCPRSSELTARVDDFARRARNLLTPTEFVEALTMQWGMT